MKLLPTRLGAQMRTARLRAERTALDHKAMKQARHAEHVLRDMLALQDELSRREPTVADLRRFADLQAQHEALQAELRRMTTHFNAIAAELGHLTGIPHPAFPTERT